MANYPSQRQQTVARTGTIDLNRVHAFVRVVEDGSFTAAARRLGLPKSSVSRSVTALERELGVRLLQRTTRALHLTDAGRTWFQQVRPALASLADSTASVRSLGTEPRGRVRVSCPPDGGELLLPLVKRFRRKYPAVDLDLSFTARHVDLVAEGFDLAVRAGELKDSSLVVRKIQNTDLGLYAAPSYLRRAGTPRSLEELKRHACLTMSAPSGRTTWTLSGPTGEPTSVEVQSAISADSMPFLVRAAAEGLGIAMLPEVVVAGAPEALVRVLPALRRVGIGLNVVSPSRGYEPRAVALFKEELIAELTRHTARCTSEGRAFVTGRKARALTAAARTE